jgi:DNA replication protein DnaC
MEHNCNNMQMNNLNEKERVFNYAKELKLNVLRDELDDFIALATEENWSYRALICQLLSKEMELRIENRRRMRVRIAGFPELKYLQELVREELPKDAKNALPELETLEFIKEGRNIVFCGNPGTGKTHLSIALGIKACMEGYTVFFTSVPHLLTQIRECRSQKSLRQLELRFQRYDMVICDEFGYVSCDKEGGELLFNHLSLRAGKKTTIITTNLAFSRWGEIVKDKILVAAMVDRLTHKAYLINMNGQSYRVKETQKMLLPDEE